MIAVFDRANHRATGVGDIDANKGATASRPTIERPVCRKTNIRCIFRIGRADGADDRGRRRERVDDEQLARWRVFATADAVEHTSLRVKSERGDAHP